jgi:hypothetical protein
MLREHAVRFNLRLTPVFFLSYVGTGFTLIRRAVLPHVIMEMQVIPHRYETQHQTPIIPSHQNRHSTRKRSAHQTPQFVLYFRQRHR